jgi:hypothetical protein
VHRKTTEKEENENRPDNIGIAREDVIPKEAHWGKWVVSDCKSSSSNQHTNQTKEDGCPGDHNNGAALTTQQRHEVR